MRAVYSFSHDFSFSTSDENVQRDMHFWVISLSLLIAIPNRIDSVGRSHDDDEPETEETATIGLDAALADGSTEAPLRTEIEQSEGGEHVGRSKRKLSQFASMMFKVLGCDPLRYSGYGCYCGPGGSGTPVDGIDRCCQQHDECYLKTSCGSTFYEYTSSYIWSHSDGRVTCNPQGVSECGLSLCMCDMTFVGCLSQQETKCPSSRPICASVDYRNFWKDFFDIHFCLTSLCHG